MIDRRRPALAALASGLLLLLGVGASPAHALRDVTATVDVVAVPEGTQLVVRINGGNAVLVREHGATEFEINETGSFGMAVTAAAAGRCRLDPESDGTRVFCGRAGLLTATATRKPLRFEMGPEGGRVTANDSPLAVEVQGGPGRDGVGGSPFDDLIRLGDGNDSADGYPGNDLIEFGAGDDQGGGGGGDDRIDGGPGHDIIGGGAGRDTQIGGPGDDLIFAQGNSEHAWASEDIVRDGDGNVTEYVDEPTDCGPGSDTVSQQTVALDPVLSNCEATLLQASGDGALGIQGTLQVGSTLTAARPPLGVEASFQDFRWYSCGSVSYGALASECVTRSSCSTLRLEPQDAGRQIMVIARVTYTLSGGRYKLQPGDEYVWTSLGVGASSAPLGRNDQDRWMSGGASWLYIDAPGYQDRTGDPLGSGPTEGGQVCAPLTGPVNGTRTDGTTDVTQSEGGAGVPAGPPPASVTPGKPGAGPAGAAAPASSAKALATQLAKAIGRSTRATLLRKRALTVSAAAADGTVIRVQVKRGNRWVNVGVGRIATGRVTVKLGSTGRARLKAARANRGKVALRVLVRSKGERDTVVSASLKR